MATVSFCYHRAMPARRLSQHFLFDPSILRRIVEVAEVAPEDTVLEVGPGPGRLTAMLAERARRVIAVELDHGLFEKLGVALAKFHNVEMVEGDALKYPLEEIREKFKAVANIPYHITTPLIFKLLEHRDRLVSTTLTVQKEVAERICARSGGKDYGLLSLAVQYRGRPRVAFVIPRGAFRPVPKVDSACLHVEIRKRPAVAVRDEDLFFRLMKVAFSQRRKTLRNSLKSLSHDVEGALRAAGIEPGRRAETLGMEDFARLADILSRMKTDKHL